MAEKDDQTQHTVQCEWHNDCPMRHYALEGKLDIAWIQEYCKGDWEKCVRYKLQKNGQPAPDWMLPDGSLDKTLRDA